MGKNLNFDPEEYLNMSDKEREEFIEQMNDMKKRRAQLKNWIRENFLVAYNFGNGQLAQNNAPTKEEHLQAKKIFKLCKQTNDIDELDRMFLFFAFALLIHNTKDHLRYLKNIKSIPQGYRLHFEKFDDVEAFNVENMKWEETGEETGIEIYAGSKKKPKVKGETDPVFAEAAKILSKYYNKLNGKTHGVPEFVNSLAFQVDYWLKKIMPGVTTDAIICKLLIELQVGAPYDDIHYINTWVKRGRKALSK